MIDDTAEVAAGVRALLDRPFLTRTDPAWPAVAGHADTLTRFFEDSCGWVLRVDRRAGTARLRKRHRQPDPTRPQRRDNGSPMRRDHYGLLFLIAAELITRPTSTVGDLADNVAVATQADTRLPGFSATVHANRLMFAELLGWFVTARFAAVTAGSLDRYSRGDGDAVIVADQSRLSQLLATDTPPSRITADTTDGWVEALSHEPRYQLVHDGRGDPDAVNRYARHQLGRAVLDDPVVAVDRLDEQAARYLGTITGRARLQHAAETAGFVLEESRDVLVAVDPTGEATDRAFGGTTDIVTQVAAAILDELCPNRDSADPVPYGNVEAFVAGLLAADPGWAVSYQTDSGPRALTAAALAVLEAFGLARCTARDSTGTVSPLPAAGRYVTTIIDSRRKEQP